MSSSILRNRKRRLTRTLNLPAALIGVMVAATAQAQTVETRSGKLGTGSRDIAHDRHLCIARTKADFADTRNLWVHALVKTTSGIDFLFMPDNSPRPWQGDATGEKGSLWSDG
jgi:hypothetical protein